MYVYPSDVSGRFRAHLECSQKPMQLLWVQKFPQHVIIYNSTAYLAGKFICSKLFKHFMGFSTLLLSLPTAVLGKLSAKNSMKSLAD